MVEVGTNQEVIYKRSEVFSTADFFRISQEKMTIGAYITTTNGRAFHVTDQFFETSSQLDYGEYMKIVLSKFSSISSVRVCSLRSPALFDVRILDFNDPNDRGDTGSKCVLKRSDMDNSIIYDSIEDSTCQTFVCAGTAVHTYVGQVVTVKFLDENSISSGAADNILDREILTDLDVSSVKAIVIGIPTALRA